MTPNRTATTENFPVASWLIRPANRAPIMAFYRFARAADDIADHAPIPPAAKLDRLEAMRATIAGEAEAEPTSLALREAMAARRLDRDHALDLLKAFVRDVTTPSTATYDDLLGYCAKSAMPVGRFVLDVHGEDRATWPASDALCAALQIINHLQDCGKDFREMGRVYIPDDMLNAAGLDIDVLGGTRSPPALRTIIADLARRAEALLAQSAPFSAMLRDRRLAAEVRVIQRLAEDLARQLQVRDPLAERVAHSKPRAAWLALTAVVA
ncbi:squalene synthase HpnC [Polymorphobacter megasporae]|uniref:squalene synthase HpnC n=1 Tax=Glacieibacterium megasporae TaxID=2835787 RepID=UPI001C1DFBB8|nr:squalene synthase HpnC [Polymorphobacter megasporae]UAJ09738.1 squalene synthase HpnC [Polymorphobacter megasporae]